MFFPESPRVSYARNPLEQVICQLRYPGILKIAAQPPVGFQEAVRSRFPILNERKEPAVELPAELAGVFPVELFSSPSDVAYDFGSEDEKWTLSLAKDFLALTCRGYKRWEEFRGVLESPVAALQQEFRPSFFGRVGLRYRNVIVRSSLDLAPDYSWGELLQPYVLGFMQEPEIANSLRSLAHESLLLSGSNEQVRVRHGLVRRKESGEVCFLIDADFFIAEKVDCERAFEILDRFNVDAGRLFRWCIKERLHDALGPSAVARSGN